MKNLLCILLIICGIGTMSCSRYKYEIVEGDPLKARIYTLDNGLKVYITAYKDAPRVQSFVAVRVGGKNDPAETTGLAHYFEHLMFKGTSKFGTMDYAREKPLLDSIERLFEIYRTKTDEGERKALYRQIDGVSQEAAKFALANEYDKLMSAIGAVGVNAYTNFDATVYREDFPSNQFENWAKIQAERFSDPVIRLFHTELETVYEEKNRSYTSDTRKMYEAMLSGLFPKHPYGTQTVLGTQEDLKNPSITNIKNYFKRYYIPNNMAVCLSGDLDPEKTIAIIDKYFGKLKRGEDVAPLSIAEEPLTQPVVKTVWGNDAARVAIAYRFGGANSDDALKLLLLDMILSNGQAGLIDLNVRQKQRLLGANSQPIPNADYQALLMMAYPKQGQSLDEARDILLEQVELLKKGEFEEWLIPAVIADLKLRTIRQMESNAARADAFVDAFINRTAWVDYVSQIDQMAKITKDEIVAFANQKLGDNYVLVYKMQGPDPNIKYLDKPAITPIKMNRDSVSAFVAAIQAAEVKPIAPVFVDYKKEIKFLDVKGVPVWYKQNEENRLFDLNYVFEMGSNNDRELALAIIYLEYLGTDKYTASQLKQEFYKLGCSFSVYSSEERVYVSLNGLTENIAPALQLFEHLLANASVNEEVYKNLVGDLLKSRNDAKLNHNANYRYLRIYGRYGAKSPATNILGAQELQTLPPERLIEKIRSLLGYEHKVLYYGPQTADEVTALLAAEHKIPDALKPVPEAAKFEEQPTDKGDVFFVHYDAPQTYMTMLSKLGAYDKSKEAIITLYNEYFGGSMNAIVFQEMREARGLAYSASASYSQPSRLDQANYVQTFIGTQPDKLRDAEAAFKEILNDMPQSQKGFEIAKENIVANLRTQRITKSGLLWTYLNNLRKGIDYDIRRDIFEQTPAFTLDDVVKFQQQNVKGLPYTYCILGDEKKVDFSLLNSWGKVRRLSQTELFGY